MFSPETASVRAVSAWSISAELASETAPDAVSPANISESFSSANISESFSSEMVSDAASPADISESFSSEMVSDTVSPADVLLSVLSGESVGASVLISSKEAPAAFSS